MNIALAFPILVAVLLLLAPPGNSGLKKNYKDTFSRYIDLRFRPARKVGEPSKEEDKSDTNSGKIYFPDQLPLKKPEPRFVPSEKEIKCIDENCEYAENYPIDIIRKIVTSESMELLGDDVLEEDDYPDMESDYDGNGVTEVAEVLGDAVFRRHNFSTKGKSGKRPQDPVVQSVFRHDMINDFVEETSVCPMIQSYIYPQVGSNRNSEKRFVVNIKGEKFVQAVRIESCIFPDTPCEIREQGYETVCRQKYTFKKLLAVNPRGKQYFDSFRFPSCCVCYKRSVYNFNFFDRLQQNDNTKLEALNKTNDQDAGIENVTDAYENVETTQAPSREEYQKNSPKFFSNLRGQMRRRPPRADT